MGKDRHLDLRTVGGEAEEISRKSRSYETRRATEERSLVIVFGPRASAGRCNYVSCVKCTRGGDDRETPCIRQAAVGWGAGEVTQWRAERWRKIWSLRMRAGKKPCGSAAATSSALPSRASVRDCVRVYVR